MISVIDDIVIIKLEQGEKVDPELNYLLNRVLEISKENGRLTERVNEAKRENERLWLKVRNFPFIYLN